MLLFRFKFYKAYILFNKSEIKNNITTYLYNWHNFSLKGLLYTDGRTILKRWIYIAVLGSSKYFIIPIHIYM